MFVNDVIEPQPDQLAPTREDVERLLVFGREVSETPEAHLLVHCRAGVSRFTAAALILMQANPEWPASAALDAVAAIRPRAWPNLLILEFGDAVLGRNGEIVAATVMAAQCDFIAASTTDDGSRGAPPRQARRVLPRLPKDAPRRSWQNSQSHSRRRRSRSPAQPRPQSVQSALQRVRGAQQDWRNGR